MIITTNDIKKPYKILGVVTSIKTMSLGIAKDFFGAVGDVVGQDLAEINKQYETLRYRGFQELIEKIKGNKADGIVGLKMDFSQVASPNGSGILVLATYGTMIQLINDTENIKGGKKTKTKKNLKTNKHHK